MYIYCVYFIVLIITNSDQLVCVSTHWDLIQTILLMWLGRIKAQWLFGNIPNKYKSDEDNSVEQLILNPKLLISNNFNKYCLFNMHLGHFKTTH